MFKTLLKNVGEFKRASILTPIYTSMEVLVSAFIPYVTASIIDKGINGGESGAVGLGVVDEIIEKGLKDEFMINDDSVILVINTEGKLV